VAATGAELLFGALEIGMAIAGAFGLTFASNDGYEAFGNNIHNAVISTPGPAGSEWWNRSLAGNIILTGLDATVKTAIWGCAKKAANMYVEAEPGPFATKFTLSSYSLNRDGSVDSRYDYRGKSYSVSYSPAPVYCVEFSYLYGTDSNLPYRGNFGVCFVSSANFDCSSTYNKVVSGCYFRFPEKTAWIDDVRLRKNCLSFQSPDDFNAYCINLVALSSASSAGGATAAYPAYGYDGVDLPNIDLTQPGLIGADGNSTVSELIAQLQSGAITWEDYIGTVAPGQTATITITDENGATLTYTLTNTGVGTLVKPGTDVTEPEPGDETIPVVIPPGGEIATNDIVELLKLIISTVTNFMDKVVTLLQSIYDWCVATWNSFLEFCTEVWTQVKAFFADVLTALKSVYDAVVEWCTKLVDAVVQLGIQIGEFIANAVETIVTTVKTWLQWVVEQLLAGLQALAQTLIDAITAIFVPSADFITAKVDALRARFNFADSIIVTGEAIRDSLNGFSSEPPIIYAELANSRGQYDWGVRAIALDLTWYSEYKPTVDGIISSFLWLMFAWKIFVKLSGIINGAGSDAKYVMQHERKMK